MSPRNAARWPEPTPSERPGALLQPGRPAGDSGGGRGGAAVGELGEAVHEREADEPCQFLRGGPELQAESAMFGQPFSAGCFLPRR